MSRVAIKRSITPKGFANAFFKANGVHVKPLTKKEVFPNSEGGIDK